MFVAIVLAAALQDRSLAHYIASRDPVSGTVYLGLLFAGLTFLVKGPVGLGSGLLSGWLRSHPKALGYLYRTSGAVLVGLGNKLAFERRA